MLVVDDEALAAEITEAYEADLARSERMTVEGLKRVRWYHAVLVWAGLALREHL